MKQTNEKNERIGKMMESYYSYIGYCHTENIIKELDARKDEINQIKIPSSMDEWFEKFSRKYRIKNRLKRLIENTQKIGKKVAIFKILILSIGTVFTSTIESFWIETFNFFIETYERNTQKIY